MLRIDRMACKGYTEARREWKGDGSMLIIGDGRRRAGSRSRKRKRRTVRWRGCFGAVSVLLLMAGGFYGVRSYQRHMKDERGSMAEERTPPKVSLDAYDYEGWYGLLAENRVSAEYKEGLTAFAFDSGSDILERGRETLPTAR